MATWVYPFFGSDTVSYLIFGAKHNFLIIKFCRVGNFSGL